MKKGPSCYKSTSKPVNTGTKYTPAMAGKPIKAPKGKLATKK